MADPMMKTATVFRIFPQLSLADCTIRRQSFRMLLPRYTVLAPIRWVVKDTVAIICRVVILQLSKVIPSMPDSNTVACSDENLVVFRVFIGL